MLSNREKKPHSANVGSLCRFPNGLHGTVVDVAAADVELQGRLMGMGLFIGTRFQLLRSGAATPKTPFLLAIGETRIALDHDIARAILVAWGTTGPPLLGKRNTHF